MVRYTIDLDFIEPYELILKLCSKMASGSVKCSVDCAADSRERSTNLQNEQFCILSNNEKRQIHVNFVLNILKRNMPSERFKVIIKGLIEIDVQYCSFVSSLKCFHVS
jgi:hypothetical protein